MLTTEEMIKLGKNHATEGKQCTPFDCQEIDKLLFSESKKQERPFAWYSEMRGAFNEGWQIQYFQIISNA